MIDIFMALAVVMLGGVGCAWHAAMRAPVGYEDENGFHFGPSVTESAHDFPAAVADLSH
jgi:hypothetical protein